MTAGLFQRMEALGLTLPWTGDNIMTPAELDLLYYGNHGDKVTSPLVDKLLTNGKLSESAMDALASQAHNMYYKQWTRLYAVFIAEYTPEYNTDVTEEEEIDDTDERTPNLTHDIQRDTQKVQSQKVTETPNVTHTIDETTTRNTVQTVTETPNVTTTDVENVQKNQTVTVKDSPAETSTVKTSERNLVQKQTTTPNARTSTTSTMAYDGTDWAPTEKTEEAGSETVQTEYTGEPDKDTETVSLRTPGENVTTYSGSPDKTDRTVTESGTRETSTRYSGEPDKVHTQDTESGNRTIVTEYEGEPDSDHTVDKETGNEMRDAMRTRTFRRFGNIGVQTTAQILQLELDLWKDMNMWEIICAMLDKLLTSRYYNN